MNAHSDSVKKRGRYRWLEAEDSTSSCGGAVGAENTD